ncbi:MAG: hypothetical protein JSR73_12155 [Proteobacteria bacterium]|nr:hypothetical protein [Pseudomonadota bacterium]
MASAKKILMKRDAAGDLAIGDKAELARVHRSTIELKSDLRVTREVQHAASQRLAEMARTLSDATGKPFAECASRTIRNNPILARFWAARIESEARADVAAEDVPHDE